MRTNRKLIHAILTFILLSLTISGLKAQNKGGIDITTIECLKRIDLSNDTVLSNVLNDAINKNSNAYYTVVMNRYKNGTLVRIIKSKGDMFDQRSNIVGYTLVNNRPVVFYRGVTNYAFNYSSDSIPLQFKLGTFDYTNDADEVMHYYILENIYARFSPEAGWIWSDGKPDE